MISDERLLMLCRELSSYVRSGLSVGGIFEDFGSFGGRGAMARAAEAASCGKPFHKALAAQNQFPAVLVALVRAGEESGKLDEFLDRFADCLEVRIEFKRKLKQVLLYPVFAVGLAIAVYLFIALVAVPAMLSSFSEAGVSVSPSGIWLSSLGQLLSAQRGPVLAISLFLFLALGAFSRSREGRKLWSLAGHWIPGFRFAAEHSRYDRIATTLGLLMQTGMPMAAMMEVLLQLFEDDPVAYRRFSRAAARVSSGSSFSENIGDVFPGEDQASLKIAEKAGRLDEALLRLGKAHRDKQTHRLKILGTCAKIFGTLALAPLCVAVIWTLIQPIRAILSGVPDALVPGLNTRSAPAGVVVPSNETFQSLSSVTPADFAGNHMFNPVPLGESTQPPIESKYSTPPPNPTKKKIKPMSAHSQDIGPTPIRSLRSQ